MVILTSNGSVKRVMPLARSSSPWLFKPAQPSQPAATRQQLARVRSRGGRQGEGGRGWFPKHIQEISLWNPSWLKILNKALKILWKPWMRVETIQKEILKIFARPQRFLKKVFAWGMIVWAKKKEGFMLNGHISNSEPTDFSGFWPLGSSPGANSQFETT